MKHTLVTVAAVTCNELLPDKPCHDTSSWALPALSPTKDDASCFATVASIERHESSLLTTSRVPSERSTNTSKATR